MKEESKSVMHAEKILFNKSEELKKDEVPDLDVEEETNI